MFSLALCQESIDNNVLSTARRSSVHKTIGGKNMKELHIVDTWNEPVMYMQRYTSTVYFQVMCPVSGFLPVASKMQPQQIRSVFLFGRSSTNHFHFVAEGSTLGFWQKLPGLDFRTLEAEVLWTSLAVVLRTWLEGWRRWWVQPWPDRAKGVPWLPLRRFPWPSIEISSGFEEAEVAGWGVAGWGPFYGIQADIYSVILY